MYTRFQTKTAQKSFFGAAHTTGLYKGVPPPPPPREFVPRSVPIVFLLTVNRICLAVTLLFAPKQVYIFLFRGKIQLLKHGEFTLGDSDMILIIMTSLLNI